MANNYLLLGCKRWFKEMPSRLAEVTGHNFQLISTKEELENFNVDAFNPKAIFVTHWSWILPKSLWQSYETIVFHMTDLPFGRGGSPLQNLITRGITETKLSAFRCTADIDAGPIYLKRPLSLYGSAEEIFLRASNVMLDMIREIIINQPVPIPQIGEPVIFTRRTPKDSMMNGLHSLEEIFNYIRMLDADGYPHAYFDIPPFRLYFTRASMYYQNVVANVKIKLIEDD